VVLQCATWVEHAFGYITAPGEHTFW